MAAGLDPSGMTLQDAFGVAEMLSVAGTIPPAEKWVEWVKRWQAAERSSRERGLR